MTGSRPCDVLVIGGGPAGSTIATLLARKGHDVILLEQDRAPRTTGGEILLPATLNLLQTLGVLDEVAAIGRPCTGFEFVAPDGAHAVQIDFGQGWNPALATALQVRRADLDACLLHHARQAGVAVVEGCRAREIELLPARGGARVGAHLDHGARLTFQSRFLVDATGRDALLGHKLRTRMPDRAQRGAGLQVEFAVAVAVAVADAAAAAMPATDVGASAELDTAASVGGTDAAGRVSVFWPTEGAGRAWSMALADGSIQVGLSPELLPPGWRNRPVGQAVDEALLRVPALGTRLAAAGRSAAIRVTDHDAHAMRRCHGDSHLLVGDAFGAIGPDFFTGVLMAMKGGVVGAEAVDTLLRDPACHDSALARYERVVRRGPRELAWFVERMDRPALRELLMEPPRRLGMRAALLALLAGDVHGDSPIQPSLLAFKAVYHLRQLLHPRRTWGTRPRRGPPTIPIEEPVAASPTVAGPGP